MNHRKTGIIQHILNNGIDEHQDHWLAGKIRLLNIMALFSSFVMIFFGISNIIITDNIELIIIDFSVSVVILIPYVLNHYKKFMLARGLFIIMPYFVLALFVIMYGNEHIPFQYFFIPGSMLSLIFFRDEIGNKKWALSLLGVIIWFISKHDIFYDHLLSLNQNHIIISVIWGVVFLFITHFLMLYSFIKENDYNVERINQMNYELHDMAITDYLTGIYNRRYIINQLTLKFEEAKRNGLPMAIAILDIDHFKKVNDTYGHFIGDKILKMLTELAKCHFGENRLVGRLGGEEFMIIFDNHTLEEARKKMTEFHQMINQQELIWANDKIKITVSSVLLI